MSVLSALRYQFLFPTRYNAQFTGVENARLYPQRFDCSTPLEIPVALPGWRDAEQSCGRLDRTARLFGHRPDSHPHPYIYFTGILITIAPITSLILKSRLGLSGWALWQPMQAWVTARSG